MLQKKSPAEEKEQKNGVNNTNEVNEPSTPPIYTVNEGANDNTESNEQLQHEENNGNVPVRTKRTRKGAKSEKEEKKSVATKKTAAKGRAKKQQENIDENSTAEQDPNKVRLYKSKLVSHNIILIIVIIGNNRLLNFHFTLTYILSDLTRGIN